MPGRKSDVKDAQWIASLLHKGLLRNGVSRFYQNNTMLPAKTSPERAEREAYNHINTLYF